MGPGGVNGVQEFFTNGTWTAPANITRVMVEMWGAGGGGGWAPSSGACSFPNGGGGAYTLDVVEVTPGVTYNVVVGTGGVGATSVGTSGTNGGGSQFVSGSNILTFAGGGQGGPSTCVAGSGGLADTNAMISHSGLNPNAYADNLAPPNAGPNSSLPNFGYGGNGAVGGGSTTGGQPGYVLLRW